MTNSIDEMAKQIEKELKEKINDLLENKIAEEIQKDLAMRATGEVYGAYSPEIYERRFTLNKPASYSIESGELKVSITPTAEFNRAYGGWNYGNELGGFMNFGRGWHGYVMGRGAYSVPMPRPYLSNAAQDWNYLIEDKIKEELGEWADVVTVKVTLGDD